MTKAASDTIKMKGNMMRVSSTAKADFSASKPGASTAIRAGAKTMPSSVTMDMKTSASVAILRAKSHAASWLFSTPSLENTVTKATDNAPSANKSRSRFGAR